MVVLLGVCQPAAQARDCFTLACAMGWQWIIIALNPTVVAGSPPCCGGVSGPRHVPRPKVSAPAQVWRPSVTAGGPVWRPGHNKGDLPARSASKGLLYPCLRCGLAQWIIIAFNPTQFLGSVSTKFPGLYSTVWAWAG